MSPLVASVGHSFPNLDIERGVLGRLGARLALETDLSSGMFDWADVEAVLVGTQLRIDAARIAAMPRCRAVVRYGIGVDNVDLDAARARGIFVSNVTDYCREEVALHALAMALALLRGLPHWDATVKAGAWRGTAIPKLRRPSAMCLGVIGLGQIGRTLAAQASGVFGRIVGYDPWLTAGAPPIAGVERVDVLDVLLAAADVISVHVPLTDETRGLIGRTTMARLKPGVILINVARGGVIDEAALAERLASGAIGGAGLDTFETEPLPPGHPLLAAPHTLLSPHMAWLSDAASADLRRLAAEEAARILVGEPPRSRVA